ncbi:DUF6207 family protein [Streptomyces sp. NPDC005385]|uniref:DUF6207 family protein n=1 Tax=Streptomyces sp. NPDC005385 TaxID=3157039 RepID=UPI0033AAB7DD
MRPGVEPYMEPINETNLSRPGLLVVDVAVADDPTALAWPSSPTAAVRPNRLRQIVSTSDVALGCERVVRARCR